MGKKSYRSAGMGRNAPCPCGSGKKYKKCCEGKKPAALAGIQADNASPGRSASAPRDTPRLVPPGQSPLQIHPYTIAKMAEDTRMCDKYPDLRKKMERHMAEDWTIRKVAAMTTSQIEDQLQAYGVKHRRERFLSLASRTWSAWTVADCWEKLDPVRLKGREVDFLGLAACELWKRLLPERPSIEMLDDWMQEGYRLLEDGRIIDACERWWDVWLALQPRFSPEMRRMDDASTLFLGMQSLFNWAQEFETELGNAAESDPRLAPRGIQYCTEWLAQFTGEGELLQANFRRALAWFYFRLGEANKGRQILEATIETWPHSVWGYFALSDAYSHLLGSTPLAKDLDKAISLLEQGLIRAEADLTDRQILEDRLADLRQEKSGSC